jgi:hypothetical protein
VSRALLVLVLANCLLASPPVRGGPAEEAPAAYAKGQRLYREKRYVGAVAAFERAYRLMPHFRVQCSIARCYQNLNRMLEAARHYRRCLEEGAAKTKGMAERVRNSLAEVEAQITWIRVQGRRKGGTIYVDGEAAGETPNRVPLDPGLHVVEVRRPGARAARVKIRTLGGEERELTLEPTGLAETSKEPEPEPPPIVRRSKRRRVSQVWFWTAVGVTAALAVAVAVLGSQTAGLREDFDADPTDEAADRFYARRRLTNAFVVAAGVAAAGTTTLFFFTDFGGGESDGGPRALVLGVRGAF